MLGVVNKLLNIKSLLTMPSNVLPLWLKQIFPPIIQISFDLREIRWIHRKEVKRFLLYQIGKIFEIYRTYKKSTNNEKNLHWTSYQDLFFIENNSKSKDECQYWIIWSGIKKKLIWRILLLVRPIHYLEAVITIPCHIKSDLLKKRQKHTG